MLNKNTSILIENYKQHVKSYSDVKQDSHNNIKKRLAEIVEPLTGNLQQYHGQSFVPSELSKGSGSTYWVAVVANAINVLTTAPALYFGFLNLGPFGLVLTSVMSTGILKLSNESASAASASTKGNRFWSNQGLMLFVSINILLSIISGIGSELMINRSELRRILATELLDTQAKTEPDSADYRYHKTKCQEVLDRMIGLPKGNDVRVGLHHDAHNTDDGFCTLAKQEEQELEERLIAVSVKLEGREAFGNDVKFLKDKFPNVYSSYFTLDEETLDEEISSGAVEFRLAFEAFFGNLIKGDYANLGKMGFSLFVFSISVVTSSGACLMMVAHTCRTDTQLSHDPYVRTAIAEHLAYLERSILSNDSTSVTDLESDKVSDLLEFAQNRGSKTKAPAPHQQNHSKQPAQSKPSPFSNPPKSSKYKRMVD